MFFSPIQEDIYFIFFRYILTELFDKNRVFKFVFNFSHLAVNTPVGTEVEFGQTKNQLEGGVGSNAARFERLRKCF